MGKMREGGMMESSSEPGCYYDRALLPNQGQAFQEFLRSYPLYLDTLVVDHIREQEYPHLNERSQVCLDYMGVGLFSYTQQATNPLGLAYISANLATHALYTAEETEMMVRRRVLRYMNIDESEYAIVFTANKLSAFKLLGESYPFHLSTKLLLGYDHRDESQDALAECARSKGAAVVTANLTWPSLKLSKADVKSKLVAKAKKGGWGRHQQQQQQQRQAANAGDFSPNQSMPMSTQGMMAYPVLSCGSGAKNSLQWVREANQNGWHVLLDVSGLGAKAMDTLGLNLFHPDFIVGSFYKVFGSDPTGFGCLVIKKSVIRSLGNSSRARAIGMVRIVSTASAPPVMGSTRSSSSRDSFSSAVGSWDWADGKLREHETLHAQFDERFICDPPPKVVEAIEDDVSKESWAKMQSSSAVELEISSRRKFHSAEQAKELDVAGPRFGRCKEQMAGLRYLQIPNQQEGWEDGFLSKDFGKKSPLMLTLPTGFDSPSGNRGTPPFSKHEVRQEFLMGSLPATPSSVSAPCSPRLKNPSEPTLPGAIVCRGLDLADEIGLTRINFRLRALINWLISSLRKLRHSTPGHPHVVLIYGPLCQNDRSSTFSFNIAGSDGLLLDPVLVQRLADRNSISLATSVIQGSFCLEPEPEEERVSSKHKHKRAGREQGSPDLARHKWGVRDESVHTTEFSVLCASLCFLTSFTDAYRLLDFAALFLDADFVHRELFHYRALNQQTILM